MLYDSLLGPWFLKSDLFYSLDSKNIIKDEKTYDNSYPFQFQILLSNTENVYTRRAYSLYDLLIKIGGLFSSIFIIINIFVTFFQAYFLNFSLISKLYLIQDQIPQESTTQQEQLEKELKGREKFQLSFCEQVLNGLCNWKCCITYCFCFCSKLAIRNRKILRIGYKKVLKDLDLINIIKQIKAMKDFRKVFLSSSKRRLLKFQRNRTLCLNEKEEDEIHKSKPLAGKVSKLITLLKECNNEDQSLQFLIDGASLIKVQPKLHLLEEEQKEEAKIEENEQLPPQTIIHI